MFVRERMWVVVDVHRRVKQLQNVKCLVRVAHLELGNPGLGLGAVIGHSGLEKRLEREYRGARSGQYRQSQTEAVREGGIRKKGAELSGY